MINVLTTKTRSQKKFPPQKTFENTEVAVYSHPWRRPKWPPSITRSACDPRVKPTWKSLCVCVSLLNYCTEKSIPCRYAENIYSANWMNVTSKCKSFQNYLILAGGMFLFSWLADGFTTFSSSLVVVCLSLKLTFISFCFACKLLQPMDALFYFYSNHNLCGLFFFLD